MENCRERLMYGVSELGINVTEVQIEAMLNFIGLIEKWNKAYSLTAIRNVQEMVEMHLLDSLSVIPYLNPALIADIGTGAGLPGIPLAICLPEYEFYLLDSNSKKTRFVQQAILELKLKNVEIVHSRVELFKPRLLFNTVITRAFASLQDILNLNQHLLADNGILLAMKGQVPVQELAEIKAHYTVLPLQVPGISAERCLIRLNKEWHG